MNTYTIPFEAAASFLVVNDIVFKNRDGEIGPLDA